MNILLKSTLIFISFFLTSCYLPSDPNNEFGTGSSGSVALSLTDNSKDSVDSLWVTIESININMTSPKRYSFDLLNEPQSFNIRSLDGIIHQLIQVPLRTGTYDSLDITFGSQGAIEYLDGSTNELMLSEKNFKISLTDFNVYLNRVSNLNLDFDLSKWTVLNQATKKLVIPITSIKKITDDNANKIYTKTFQFVGRIGSISENKIKVIKDDKVRIFKLSDKFNVDQLRAELGLSDVSSPLVSISGVIDNGVYSADIIHKITKQDDSIPVRSLIYGVFDGAISSLSSEYYIVKANISNSFSQSIPTITKGIKLKIPKSLYPVSKSCLFHQTNLNFTAKGYSSDGFFVVEHIKTPENKKYILDRDDNDECHDKSNSVIVKSHNGSDLLVSHNGGSFTIPITNIKITNGNLSCLVPGALIRHIGPINNPAFIHIIQGCPDDLKNKEDKSPNFINIKGSISSIESSAPSTHSPILDGKYSVLAHKLPGGEFLPSTASIYFNKITKKIDILSDSDSNDFLGAATSFQDVSPSANKYYTIFNPTSRNNDLVEVKAYNDYIQLIVDSGEEIIIRSALYTSIKSTKHITSINLDILSHKRLSKGDSTSPASNVKLHLNNNIRFSSGIPSSLTNGDTIIAYGTLIDANNLKVSKILFPVRELKFDMTSKPFTPITIDPQILDDATSKNIKSTIHSALFKHFNNTVPHYNLNTLTPYYNPDGKNDDIKKDNEYFFNFLYSNLIDIDDVFTNGKFIIKDFNNLYLASVLQQLNEYFDKSDLKIFTKDEFTKSLQSDYAQSLLNVFNQGSIKTKLISSLSDDDSKVISSSKLITVITKSNSSLKDILKDEILKNSSFINKFTNGGLTLEKINNPIDDFNYSDLKELDLYNSLASSLGCKKFYPPSSSGSISQNKIVINSSTAFSGSANLISHLTIPAAINSKEYISLPQQLDNAIEFKDSNGNKMDVPSWFTFVKPSLLSPPTTTSISKSDREKLLGSIAFSIDQTHLPISPINSNYTATINYINHKVPASGSTTEPTQESLTFYINVLSEKHHIPSIISDCQEMKEYYDFNNEKFDLNKVLGSNILQFEDTLSDIVKNKLFDLIDGSEGELLDTRKIRSIVNLLPPTALHSTKSKNYIYTNIGAIISNHLSAGISFASVADAKAAYPLRIDRSKVLNYLNEMYLSNQDAFEYFDKKIGSSSVSDYLKDSLGTSMYSILPINKGLFTSDHSINWYKLKEDYVKLKLLSNKKVIPVKRINDINSYFKSRYGINLNIQLSKDNKYSIERIVASLYKILKTKDFSSTFNNLVITHDINRIYSESFQEYNDGYNNSIYEKISIFRKYNSSISMSDITDEKYDKRYKTKTYALNYYKYFTIHYDLMKSNKAYFSDSMLRFIINALEHHPDSSDPKPDVFSLESTMPNFFGFDLNGVDVDGSHYADYYKTHSLSSISVDSIKSKLNTLGLLFMDPLSQSYKPVYVHDNDESKEQYKVYLHKISTQYKSLFNKGSSNTSKRGGGIGGGYNALRYQPKSIFLFNTAGYHYFLPLIGEYADSDSISYIFKNKYSIIDSVRKSINYYTGINNIVQCYYDGDNWYADFCKRLNLKPEYKSDYYKKAIYLKYFPPLDGTVPPSKYSNTGEFTYKAFNFMARYYPGFHPYMISSETGYVSRTLPSLLPNFFGLNSYNVAFSNYMIHQLANELTGKSFTTTSDYRTFILEELSKN